MTDAAVKECKHAFCTGCVTGSARMHVKEGSVDQITCMEPGCSVALPHQVRSCALGPLATEVFALGRASTWGP